MKIIQLLDYQDNEPLGLIQTDAPTSVIEKLFMHYMRDWRNGDNCASIEEFCEELQDYNYHAERIFVEEVEG